MSRYCLKLWIEFDDGKFKRWVEFFLNENDYEAHCFSQRFLNLKLDAYKIKGKKFVAYGLTTFKVEVVDEERFT